MYNVNLEELLGLHSRLDKLHEERRKLTADLKKHTKEWNENFGFPNLAEVCREILEVEEEIEDLREQVSKLVYHLIQIHSNIPDGCYNEWN